MQNWQGPDKSLVKNESVGQTFCRTEVRVYSLLCKLHHKVNIVSTCSQHHESLPPLPPSPPYPGNPHTRQAPSPGPDRWRLRLLAPADPASPSPPSPGPSRPGGAVAGLRPARRGPRQVAAPSPGQDRWRLRLQAHTRATTLLHVRTAPTPVGKVTTLLHVRTAPTPAGKDTTLLHVHTAPTPVGKGTPRIPQTRTPGRKLGALWFHNQV